MISAFLPKAQAQTPSDPENFEKLKNQKVNLLK